MERIFALEDYRTKPKNLRCPSCGKKTFKRYIDKRNGRALADDVGICDNRNKCRYHKGYSEFFKSNPNYVHPDRTEELPKEELCFLDPELLEKSKARFKNNGLYRWLSCLGFEHGDLARYFYQNQIGSTKSGEVVFWYVDYMKRVRTGQIVHYHDNGKRNRERSASSVPYRLQKKGLYTQCFFNEYLLNGMIEGEAFGLIEAPKSAHICSIYKYKGVKRWLSYTSQASLSREKLEAVAHLIKGKTCYLSHDFHFSDRMINGTLEATQKREGNILKYSRTGLEKKDMQSKKALLEEFGVNVIICDSPLGEFDDTSNDIADYLTLTKKHLLSFRVCDKCSKQRPLQFFPSISDHVCFGCLDTKPRYSSKAVVLEDAKDHEALNAFIQLFDLDPQTARFQDGWEVLAPYLANKDYTEPQEIKYHDADKWLDSHFGERIELDVFKAMINSFVMINQHLQQEFKEETNSFIIKQISK